MVGSRKRDDRSNSRDRYHGAGNSLQPATRRKSAEPEQETEENNGVHPLNGIQLTFVVTRDMVFYCFDVLLHHLKRTELPRSKLPSFTNDS